MNARVAADACKRRIGELKYFMLKQEFGVPYYYYYHGSLQRMQPAVD